jgi:hypothetical protein
LLKTEQLVQLELYILNLISHLLAHGNSPAWDHIAN